jgi:hypothetical protein
MIKRTINKIAFAVLLASLIALLSPSIASAHPIRGVGDFYAGMLHPLTALEFLLPWIALSLFAGQQGRSAALLTLALFPLALVSGTGLSMVWPSPTWVSAVDLAIIPILGLAVASAITFSECRRTTTWRGQRFGDHSFDVSLAIHSGLGSSCNPGLSVWNWVGPLPQETLDSNCSSRGRELDCRRRHSGLRVQVLKIRPYDGY